MRRRTILSSALALIMLSSCTDPVLLHSHREFGRSIWDRSDTVEFLLDSASAHAATRMNVSLRLKNSFAYREMVLIVEQRSGIKSFRDTLFFDIMKERQSPRKSVYLSEYEREVPITRERDSLSIRIFHAMRQDKVEGINDIGIRLDGPKGR